MTCRLVLTISLLLALTPVQAQMLLPIKEQTDHVVNKALYNGSYPGLVSYLMDNPNANRWQDYDFGEQVGQILHGYLVMYRGTKDKGYLFKFVNLSLRAMAWRRANYLFTDQSMQNSSLYMNGVLLGAWSGFIHLVLVEDNSLGDLAVPTEVLDIPTSTLAINVLPTSSSSTLGVIANWLLSRSVETLDYIIAENWSDEELFNHGDVIKGLNQEAVFGEALLNLGQLATFPMYSGLQSYLEMGARMLRAMRNVGEDDRCACISGSPVLIPFTNHSYYWFHDGWSHRLRPGVCVGTCLSVFGQILAHERDLRDQHEFIEDVSHAVYDLQLPYLANKYNIYTGGSEPFTDADMVMFRNAFTRNIAFPFAGSWAFKNGVDGSPGPISGNPGFNAYRMDALAWMFLREWDNAPTAVEGPGVYEILSDVYANTVFDSPLDISGGLSYWGAAQVVAAQWERECFSLDLYNRELVYDQDFAAKNVLRVFPAGEAGASFADPVIYEPRFTVNENIRSEFRAGSAVIFEPGFEAVRGSVVEAVIDPLGCLLAYKANLPMEYPRTEVRAPEAREQTMMEQDAPVSVEQTTERQMMDAFRLVPNPTSGETYAELRLSDQRSARLNIHDALGRQVWSGQFGTFEAGEHRHPVGIRLPAGVYHCTLSLDGVQHIQRLVVE